MAKQHVDVDAILEKIARNKLLIATLETRSSDCLDFYEMPVWQIKEALRAAYDAGRASK